MRVIQAQSAGFCYGVERAVRMAEEAAAAGGCVMLGSIIHNDSVVRRLEALGARQVQSAEEVQPGETVLIRAHGEPVETYRTLEARGARVLDATCPHVLRIHRLVERTEQEGRTPLIIGEDHHPEVIAAASRSSRSVVLGNAEELAEWLGAVPARRTERLLAVAQTTCIRSIWEKCVNFLKKECTNAEIFDTICDATQKRQSEAADIAGRVDVMVVVEIVRVPTPNIYRRSAVPAAPASIRSRARRNYGLTFLTDVLWRGLQPARPRQRASLRRYMQQ